MAIKTENWDGVSAPAIPSGWNVDANYTTSAPGSGTVSSPNLLVLANGATTATRFYATWGTADGNAGNVIVSGWVQFGGGNAVRLGVTARGTASTLDNSSTSQYVCYISQNPSFPAASSVVVIAKVVNGTETTLVSGTTVLGSRFSNGAWYQVIFTLSGSALSCQIVRQSDGFYLQTSNAFGSGAATYLSVSDSSISGSGYAGYLMRQGAAAQGLLADDWSLDGVASPDQPAPPSWAIGYPSLPRTAATAYQGLLSSPPAADRLQPAGDPFFPDQAPGPRRAPPDAYGGIRLPAQSDRLQPPGSQSFPSAPGPRRATPDAYRGLLSSPAYPILADATQPPGTQEWPDLARGPARAANRAYQAQSLGQFIDATQPAGTPVLSEEGIRYPDRAPGGRRASVEAYKAYWPGATSTPISLITAPIYFPVLAPGPRRAAPDAYRGLLSAPAQPDRLQPFGEPVFPDVAPGPRRAVVEEYKGQLSAREPSESIEPAMPVYPLVVPLPRRAATAAYVVTVRPALGDARQPAGDPFFPDQAPGPRRAAALGYQLTIVGAANVASGTVASTPRWPHQAPGPRRAAPAAYGGQSYQARPDRLQPAGEPFFADLSPGPRRAAAAAYVQIVAPVRPDRLQPAGDPCFPDSAAAPRRSVPENYRGLFSRQAQPDSLRPAGKPVASEPRRELRRIAVESYRGLLSAPAQPDRTQPAGNIEYPDISRGPWRSASTAYGGITRPQPPQTYSCSVASTLHLQATTGFGQIIFVSVVTSLGLEPLIVTEAGRYRWGDVITFIFPAPALPQGIPIAAVTDQDNRQYLTPALWSWDDGLTFQTLVIPDARMSPGTFNVKWLLTAAGGTSYLLWQRFEVVPGGDQESQLVALYEHQGAYGRFVLAQTRTGKLVEGVDPSL